MSMGGGPGRGSSQLAGDIRDPGIWLADCKGRWCALTDLITISDPPSPSAGDATTRNHSCGSPLGIADFQQLSFNIV